MEIRNLQVRDIFTVAKILGKVAKGARSQIIMLIANKGNAIAPVDLGLTLIQTLCIDAEEDVKAWLADMAGMKVTDFETSNPDVLIDIIEQLATKEDMRSFLARVSAFVSRIMPPESGTPGTPSSSATAGEIKTSTS